MTSATMSLAIPSGDVSSVASYDPLALDLETVAPLVEKCHEVFGVAAGFAQRSLIPLHSPAVHHVRRGYRKSDYAGYSMTVDFSSRVPYMLIENKRSGKSCLIYPRPLNETAAQPLSPAQPLSLVMLFSDAGAELGTAARREIIQNDATAPFTPSDKVKMEIFLAGGLKTIPLVPPPAP